MTISGQPGRFVVGFKGFFDFTRFMIYKASTESQFGGYIGLLFVSSPAILDLRRL